MLQPAVPARVAAMAQEDTLLPRSHLPNASTQSGDGAGRGGAPEEPATSSSGAVGSDAAGGYTTPPEPSPECVDAFGRWLRGSSVSSCGIASNRAGAAGCRLLWGAAPSGAISRLRRRIREMAPGE